MKVAWVTPFVPRSAIAEFSDHVTRALAERCSVDLWIHDSPDRRETPLPIVDFRGMPSPEERLAQYDAVFYNIGDHLGFHGAIYDLAMIAPGIVVLHDRICHNLFFNYWISRGRPDRYVDLMETYYGDVGRSAAEASFAGLRPAVWASDEELVKFPLYEEALVGARGVVVHSRSQAEAIRTRWFGPVEPLFLPAYAPTGRAGRLPASLAGEEQTLFLTIGYVNRNKQIDRVVAALAADRDLAARVRYVVIGPYDADSPYWGDLQEQIWKDDLDDVVTVLGYQPGDVLLAALERADVCINLRHPSFEGGSASLMQQLALGKPVVVADRGVFSELPDDVALKVELDARAIGDTLARLADDAELRRSLGKAARAYAGGATPDAYAERLLGFVDEVEGWQPVLRTADRAADELAVFGAAEELGLVGRVEEELAAFALGTPARAADRAAIRPLAAGDARALARFFVRNDVPEVTAGFDPFPLTAESADAIAAATGADRFYGAFLGPRVVGMAMLRGWDEGYDVPSFGVVVDRDFHGEGIGSRLTDAAIAEARRLGCPRVRLSVYGSNRVAHELYERRGFVESERRPVSKDGREDERIVMVKELDDAA
jgi:glycosyltransferase involved in cell wall biosynthesis/ribosomal protein S18 acetylase RimI-like enzyme